MLLFTEALGLSNLPTAAPAPAYDPAPETGPSARVDEWVAKQPTSRTVHFTPEGSSAIRLTGFPPEE